MFAIKYKPEGRLLGFSNSQPDVFEFELSEFATDNVWVTNSRKIAEQAVNEHPKWYNAGFETPINPFNSEDLEVVELKEIF